MLLIKTINQLTIFVVWLLPVKVPTQETSSQLKAAMQAAFDSLSYLVNVVLNDEVNGCQKEEFDAELSQLEVVSLQIGEHTKLKEYGFDLVAKSLEANINQMVANYRIRLGNLGETYLVEAIDHCVACHAKSPEIKGALNLDVFVQRINQEELIDRLDQSAVTMDQIRSVADECRHIEGRSVRENYPVCNIIESSLTAIVLRLDHGIDVYWRLKCT